MAKWISIFIEFTAFNLYLPFPVCLREAHQSLAVWPWDFVPWPVWTPLPTSRPLQTAPRCPPPARQEARSDWLPLQRQEALTPLSGLGCQRPPQGFPGGSAGKESAWLCRRPGFDPWVGKIPWSRERLPTPVSWPGEPMDCRVCGVANRHDRATFTSLHKAHWHLGEGHGPRVILLGHHSQTVSVLLDVVCLPGIKSMTWLD